MPYGRAPNKQVPGVPAKASACACQTSSGVQPHLPSIGGEMVVVPDQRATLTLDLKTADVVRWEPFSSFNRGRQMRAWVRFGHTGEAGGVPGETVAVIASLGAGRRSLSRTGLALAVRHLYLMARIAHESCRRERSSNARNGSQQSYGRLVAVQFSQRKSRGRI